ncbi:MAG: hypothetical protein AB1778_01405 [Candidatus Bipolaricaulota bacterium]
MEPNEFVDRLLSDASLDAIDFASDVERLLAEQVIFLRGELETCRREAVVGAHQVIEQLYARIRAHEDEVRFLRGQLASRGG